MDPFCNNAKIIPWKFEVNNLKNVGGDIIFKEIELFAVLVYAFHKKPIEFFDCDPVYVRIFKSARNQRIA